MTGLARRVRPGAVVLCYHNIVEQPAEVADPALHMPVDTFRWQMAFVARHFDVVSLDELEARRVRGASLRGLAAITFDDAYLGTLAHGLPVLRALQLPSTIFVPSDFPGSSDGFWWDDPGARRAVTEAGVRDRWLDELQGDGSRIRGEPGFAGVSPLACRVADWAALRAIRSDFVSLGAHSRTHRSLIALDDRDLAMECEVSAAVLQRETGAEARWIAYPYGLWDDRVAQASRAAGYTGGLTLAGADVTSGTSPWATPRINIPAGITNAAFDAWLSGFSHLRRQR